MKYKPVSAQPYLRNRGGRMSAPQVSDFTAAKDESNSDHFIQLVQAYSHLKLFTVVSILQIAA
jgi:hypothetical protein